MPADSAGLGWSGEHALNSRVPRDSFCTTGFKDGENGCKTLELPS